MAKKPTIRQKNLSRLQELVKQRVSGSTGFLKKGFKQFIAEELIHVANNQNRLLKKNETLQNQYDKWKKYYDKIFTTGMTGHALFTGRIEKNYKTDTAAGTEYYIKEHGKEHKVSYSELAYKMELFAHKLSVQHDVAFTKFKPIYYLLGKGKYKIVINIPDLNEVDFEEMTVQEIIDWFDDEGVEIIISDPTKIKNKEDREKREKAKKKRQAYIKRSKEKHYKQWKKGKRKPKKKPPIKRKRKK